MNNKNGQYRNTWTYSVPATQHYGSGCGAKGRRGWGEREKAMKNSQLQSEKTVIISDFFLT